MKTRARLVAVCILFFGAMSVGCKKTADENLEVAVDVRDERADLLFVWIDEAGETHVETSASAVPEARRDFVRVIDPKAPPSEKVTLVTLGAKQPDGSYATRSVPREEFENVVLSRRRSQGVAVLPAAGAAPAKPAPSAGHGQVTVILYGAEWCGPCHQAAAWMRQHGVAFVEKDIDHDPAAASEMRAKLHKAGLPNGSIPVIDVGGRVLVGFSPSAIEAALGKGA